MRNNHEFVTENIDSAPHVWFWPTSAPSLSAFFFSALAALHWAPAALAQDPPVPPEPDTAEEAGAEEAGADEPKAGESNAGESKPAAPAPAPAPAAEPDEAAAAEGEAEAEPTDAEMEAEMEAEMAGQDVSRPPPAGMGVIYGVVTDTKFNETIIEASVQIVGTKKKVLTDVDGRYRLELPPGTYTVRVYYELHQPARAEKITVTLGKLSRVDIQLVPDETAIEEVVIEEEADRTSLEGQTLQRRRSAVAADGVGRAEIARTPDRNAAEAAQRVVGATIVGSRFVFVRGLGERYTNSLLNGTPLPSPEPDRQTVPLDLFPALVLDSITITKQFTPDMPADFAGGSVRINTREFPRQPLFQVSVNGGLDTETSLRSRLSSRGGSTDWLGYDDGKRALPTLPAGRVEPQTDEAERTRLGKELNSYMSTTRQTAPPNYGVSVVAGNAWKIGEDKKLGAIAALTYGRSFQRRLVSFRRFNAEDRNGTPVPVAQQEGTGEEGIDNVRWGAFGNVSLELSKNHKLSLTGLQSQSATKLDSDTETFRSGTGTLRGVHLEYVSRRLSFGQLRGTHRFPALNDAEVEWHLDLAAAARDQPDTRDTLYLRSGIVDMPAYNWAPGTNSGQHFFSEQNEFTKSGGLDLTQPIVSKPSLNTKLKVGTLLTSRSRDFSARRFIFEPSGRGLGELAGPASCPGEWVATCPDKLFRQDLIGPGLLLPREGTLQFDEYTAGLDVYAGYAMLDAEIKNVRLVGGMRAEATKQTLSAWDPYNRAATTKDAKIASTDYLPAASLIFAATPKTNTRFGISRTLARPQLREIAPFSSSSYTVELPAQGNPGLRLTKITNVDLRFEHFPTMREVLAFSVFYKHFVDPIEEVIIPGTSGGVVTYANLKGANLIGVELEGRKTLEFMSPVLKDFTAIANLTLVKSRVELGAQRGAGTSVSRALSNQSPYVVNLSLDYSNQKLGLDVRVLYNVFGKRIVRVGYIGVPDAYEFPRHTLDLAVAKQIVKHLDLKLTCTNLLGAQLKYAYRKTTGYRFDEAGQLQSIGSTPYTLQYELGRIFTLTASYTY